RPDIGWTNDTYFNGMTRADDKNVPCFEEGGSNDNRAMMYGNEGKNNNIDPSMIQQVTHDAVLNNTANPMSFDDGEDDIEGTIGYEEASDEARSFARATIGQNIGSRIAQSVITLVVAVVYLWSFAPMALGLVVSAIALVILLALFPLQLYATALQLQ